MLVAVTLLDQCDAAAQAIEVLDPDLVRYGGKIIRYVGTSPELSLTVARIGEGIGRTGIVHPPPPAWKVFLVALMHMDGMADEVLLHGIGRKAVSGAR